MPESLYGAHPKKLPVRFKLPSHLDLLRFQHAKVKEGSGVEEKGIDVATGKVLVEVDPKYFRPAEVDQLLGDPSKAKKVLGWNPQKTSFEELVHIMVEHDMKKVRELYLREHLDD